MKHKNNLTPIYWANQQWFLDPRRVLVSKDLHYLIFSDIHIGIYSSFRAQGSYLPTYDQDLLNDTLKSLIADYSDYHWIVAGDIKHNKSNFLKLSDLEKEELVSTLINIINNVKKLTLLTGNHDHGLKDILIETRLDCEILDSFTLDRILITHRQDLDQPIPNGYTGVIFGHIHPVTQIQTLRGINIPVFVVNKDFMILPSFNLVTGGYDIRNLDLDVEKDKIRLFSVYNETIGEITKILR